MTINQLTISGRLTRDAEFKDVGDGLVELSVASNRSFPKKGTGGNTGVPVEWDERPTFIDVKVWKRGLVDRARTLNKGDDVIVIARLDYEQWESNGDKRSKLIATVTDKGHDLQPMGRYDTNGGGSTGNGGGSNVSGVSVATSGGVSTSAPVEDAPW